MAKPAHASPLKPDAIFRVLESHHVTEPTRVAMRARFYWAPQPTPACFSAEQFAVLQALSRRLIPQTEPEILLAAMLDARLAQGSADGWRYDAMPPDRLAFPQGMTAVEASARILFGEGFVGLAPERQDIVIRAIQAGTVKADPWAGLPPQLFFEELLTLLVEIYYAQPRAQERIGYIGMADAQGFRALGLNRRDPIETEASLEAP